jgi:predicted metalloprotease with PDZ domain
LRIIPTDGKGVRGGKTFGEKGGFISIHVGSDTIFEGLATDWMLTHEMVHLAFPSVADNHHWIEEGIATYVEPIARVRAKHLDATQMWFEVVRDLHQGLPAAGDKGLDNTHTWGRTYWGGALFCFLADIEIHQKTANRKGLDDALRGILAAGGDIRQDWPLEKALDAGDQATGAAVLRPLYEKMKDQPYDVDLPALWKQLGIEREGDTVRFVDDAPLSQTRVAITYGSAAPGSSAASAISIVAGDTAMNFPRR